MKYKWVSFSFQERNQGICNVEADTDKGALRRCLDLNITPVYDDVLILSIPQPEVSLDKLITKSEVVNLGHIPISSEREISLAKRISKTLDSMED